MFKLLDKLQTEFQKCWEVFLNNLKAHLNNLKAHEPIFYSQ